MGTLKQIGALLELQEQRKANIAMALMMEMAKTVEGQKQLRFIHEMTAIMIPNALSNATASRLGGIQQASGALLKG
jgi:hypothetical protein